MIDRLLNVNNIPADDGDVRSAVIAMRDFLAVFPALAILFPLAARTKALEMQQSGQRTLTQIANWACLPAGFVHIALGPDWPAMLAATTATELQG